jgi:hypothetical protein
MKTLKQVQGDERQLAVILKQVQGDAPVYPNSTRPIARR